MEEGKIAVHALPPDFQYCFKEILIYFSYESEPYAFTYIENRNSNDLELVKINNQLTQKIINIIDTTAIVLPQGLKNIQEEKL